MDSWEKALTELSPHARQLVNAIAHIALPLHEQGLDDSEISDRVDAALDAACETATERKYLDDYMAEILPVMLKIANQN